MLLLDTDILSQTSSGIVFLSERVAAANLLGVVVYDKFSDEDSLLNLPTPNADGEDYATWRFQSSATVIGTKQKIQIIIPAANSPIDLGGTYWLICSDTTEYYVWYNTGTSIDPGPFPNKTGVEVQILTTDTANQVAAKTSIALNLLPGFFTTTSNNILNISFNVYGPVSNPVDVSSGIIINIYEEGGTNIAVLDISNNNKYPMLRPSFPDYTKFRGLQFNIMTEYEWKIVDSVFKRIDIVRRRYPNEGSRVLGMGFSGGFEKKFSIEECLDYVYQTAVEINLHPPMTGLWFSFAQRQSGVSSSNPFVAYGGMNGIPFSWFDALVLGATIKALIAKQIFEIDTNFNISDSGISITYDRDSKYGGVVAAYVQEFEAKKKKLKWQMAPHSQSGLGTFFGFAGPTWFNAAVQGLNTRGTIALRGLYPYLSSGGGF